MVRLFPIFIIKEKFYYNRNQYKFRRTIKPESQIHLTLMAHYEFLMLALFLAHKNITDHP